MALIAGIGRAGDPGVANDQFLTAELNHFIVAGAAGVDLTDFGYNTNGTPDEGEQAVLALASVANPVIISPHASNSRIMYYTTEAPGVSASVLQTALQASGGTLADATVTAGVLTIV